MSFIDDFVGAAMTRQYGSKDAVKLRSMPTRAFVDKHMMRPEQRRRRLSRQPIDYTEYTPDDLKQAMHQANSGGTLQGVFGVGTIAAWVDANPVYHGVTEARLNIPWRRVGIKHSEEAAAWLEGTPTQKGWRKRIADPAELAMTHRNRHTAGYCGGIILWDEVKCQPEFQALDPAHYRYIRSEDRWEYHGLSKVFKVCPGDGTWVHDGLTKNDPWRHGAWYRIGIDNYNALNAMMLEALWMQAFAMPTVLATHPQGASEEQKIRFTQKVIGAVLKVIGVTSGYQLEFAQAKAEGKDTFAQTTQRLRENVSIDTWGTLGLIAGGSGFANSDLFDAMKDEIIAIEAERQARMENEQLWQPVLDWGVRRGDLSRSACNAVLEYLTESPVVIERKAKAAKALTEVGYSKAEAQRRVGLEKQSVPGQPEPESEGTPIFGYHIQGGVVTPNEVRKQLNLPPVPWGEQPRVPDGVEVEPPVPAVPNAREEEEPEPTYSEGIAAALNERNETVCPCPNHADRHCPRCGVVRRHEVRDGQWVDTWHATRRRAA